MKIRTLALLVLIVFFSAGVGVCIYWKNAPGEEEYMAAALASLEEQKVALYGVETIPKEIDPQTDRVIGIHVDSPYMIDKVISWIAKATQVRRDVPRGQGGIFGGGNQAASKGNRLWESGCCDIHKRPSGGN